MKRDPYKNPIKLSGQPSGGWSYLEKGMKRPLTGPSFWAVAQRLFQYRLANKMSGATFEQAQTDLLCKHRKKLGLGCTELATVEESGRSKIQMFKARYTGGCKSCGKKRKVSR